MKEVQFIVIGKLIDIDNKNIRNKISRSKCGSYYFSETKTLFINRDKWGINKIEDVVNNNQGSWYKEFLSLINKNTYSFNLHMIFIHGGVSMVKHYEKVIEYEKEIESELSKNNINCEVTLYSSVRFEELHKSIKEFLVEEETSDNKHNRHNK